MTYEVVDGEVAITGYTTKPTGTLVIPDEIGGYPVTALSLRMLFIILQRPVFGAAKTMLSTVAMTGAFCLIRKKPS